MSTAPDCTVGDLVNAYVSTQCRILLTAKQQLLAASVGNGHQLDQATAAADTVVHDTRVAARRLRSTLRTYAAVFDPTRARWLRAELAWFAGLLGEIRDLEVLASRLLAALAELPPAAVIGPVAAQIQNHVSERSHAAWLRARPALDSTRYRRLATELEAWQDHPPLTNKAAAPVDKTTKYVNKSTKQLSRALRSAVRAQLEQQPDAGHLLHNARKAGKRARYSVELAAPFLGATAEATIASWKQLQEILGEHQDSLVAAEFLLTAARVEAGGGESGTGFTYGVLYHRELTLQAATPELLQPFGPDGVV